MRSGPPWVTPPPHHGIWALNHIYKTLSQQNLDECLIEKLGEGVCTSMARDLQLLPPSLSFLAAARNVAEARESIKAEGLHSRGNPLSGRG